MIWILLLCFFLIAGAVWWVGLWNNVITLVTTLLAGLIASSFFPNVAEEINDRAPDFRYISEFLAVWILFLASFGLIRVATDMLSGYRLKFDPVTELIGRSLLAVWIACVFCCFASFTLHLAPLPPSAFQTNVQNRSFGIGPDRFWLAFIQSRSRGALSASRQSSVFPDYTRTPHPDDEGTGNRVFDPRSTFIPERMIKRRELSELPQLRNR